MFGDLEDNVKYDINFIGTGDPAQCSDEMQRLFRLDYTCFTFPCSFAGIYQPPFDKTKKFYATSGIRYTLEELGLLKTGNEVTWPQVSLAASQYCSQSKDSLPHDDPYAWSRCVGGTFVAKEMEHFQFAKDHKLVIEKFDTWTLGAVLYQLELMDILLEV